MTIDPTVSLGAIMIVMTTGAGFGAFIWAMRSRLDVVDVKMDSLRQDMTEARASIAAIKKALEDQVRNDMRLQHVEKLLDEMREQINEMKHGEGFVLPLSPKKAAFGGGQ